MEFLFPVKYAGVRHVRVEADTLEDAIKKCNDKADTAAKYELNLSGTTFDVLAPRLMLTKEQEETWPCWEYGYHGTDGSDWRVHYTREGKASIPDFAEESHPVPLDWLDSWKE